MLTLCVGLATSSPPCFQVGRCLGKAWDSSELRFDYGLQGPLLLAAAEVLASKICPTKEYGSAYRSRCRVEMEGTNYHQARAQKHHNDQVEITCCGKVCFDAGNPTLTKELFVSFFAPEKCLAAVLPQQVLGRQRS